MDRSGLNMTRGDAIRIATVGDEPCRVLAEKISRMLENGLTLTQDTLHFIDSTFSVPGPDALKCILTDETNSEVQTLLALIFFPDTTLQMQLEAFLETANFEPADEARVLGHLSRKLHEIPLRYPDETQMLFIDMPPWVGDQFVARLNITKRLHPDLLAAIDGHVPEDRRLWMKVALRNARFAETERRISFLAAFFEKVKDDGSYLAFILSLFEEQNDDPDIYETLVSRKRHCFRSLQKAERFLKMLQTDNMETLMLRGIRIPHVDRQDMKARMKMIDRICLAIYGKTEYFRPPEEVLGVGGYHPG